MGDRQCAEVFIPDDSYPQGERSFNISIGDNASTVGNGGNFDDNRGKGRTPGGGVRITADLSSITVAIDIDINDGKITMARNVSVMIKVECDFPQ